MPSTYLWMTRSQLKWVKHCSSSFFDVYVLCNCNQALIYHCRYELIS